MAGDSVGRGRIVDPYAIIDFVFAGNATFTLQSSKTGKHYTYRVRRAKDKKTGKPSDDFQFVELLTGPNNETDFTYIGTISGKPGTTIKWGLKAFGAGTTALEWFLAQIYKPSVLAQVEFYHESKCGRCGRTLTVPESVATGMGPECSKKGR